MKFGPNNINARKQIIDPRRPSTQSFPLLPRLLPPAALRWSAAASAAAGVSYADRGTSAIAASSLIDELHWSEGTLGEVQGAFFAGYALTQVLGGLLGGAGMRSNGGGGASAAAGEDAGDDARGRSDNDDDPSAVGRTGGYRTVLPLSLFLTGVTTLLFPLAATLGGPSWASADRFCLGLLEGLLLPAAMAGVSDTTATTYAKDDEEEDTDGDGGGNKATASSMVIAGCYLGSAWAYLSAFFLFGEDFQMQMARWGYEGSIWPWVFYVNGILSMVCLLFFREEFNLAESFLGGSKEDQTSASTTDGNEGENGSASTTTTFSAQSNLWEDTILIAKKTLTSKSGRAILAAQVGQGALLYSIASWGPLYLERVNVVSGDAPLGAASPLPSKTATATSASSISMVAATASIAASSLILPQITQALVGVTIGAAADRLASKFGTRITRRALQLIGGVIPAAVLWYLSREAEGGAGLLSPAFLFGAAQTVSALSLGAVSVSHLDVAAPSLAGAVYALGNVAAAASGSFAVNAFGRLLEDGAADAGPADEWSEMGVVGGGAEFALPFRLVAILSAVGSLIYGCTVETELEIGFNETVDRSNAR